MEKTKDLDEKTPTLQQVDFYTLEYIEAVWNISIRYLREAIKKGELTAYKVGKPYFVTHADLKEYVMRVKVKE